MKTTEETEAKADLFRKYEAEGENKSITIYKPISEIRFLKPERCFKCRNNLLFVKIKKEAILFCPKCMIVFNEWY